MQKRVIGYIDGLATANVHTAKTNKVQPASRSGKTEKTSVSGFYRAVKFAVVCMLLVFSVFCAIGSADWIISQQVKFEGSSESESYFNFDEAALQAHINIKAGEAATQSQSARAQKAAKNTAGVSTAKAATNYSAKTSSASALYAANDENAATYANESETSAQIGRATYNGAELKAFVVTSGVANAAGALPDEAIKSALTTKYVKLSSESENLPSEIKKYFADANEGMPSAAGTYAIYVTINGFDGTVSGQKDLGFAVKIFTITPCPVAIAWSGQTLNGFTYDGTAHTDVKATATVNTSESGNTVGAKANVTVGYDITRNGNAEDEIKNAGKYILTAKLTGDNAGNYTITSGETTKTTSFTVTPAALTVTANNEQITYGDNQPSFSVSYSGFVNGETSSVLSGTVAFACDYERGKNVDTYTITPSGLTSENYTITFAAGTLTVNKYGVKIAWSNTTVTYNGTAQSPVAEISNKIADLPAPELALSPASATEAGTYTVTASLSGENAGNYTITSGGTTTFTINKKAIEISITETTIVYGTAVPTKFDYKIDESSLEDKITVSFGTTYKGAVGTYDVTATISFKQGYESLKGNYAFEIDGAGKLKVTPAPLTVKAKDLSIAYGSDKPSFELEYTGFVNGETSSVLSGTVAFACEYSKGKDVDTYTITPSGLSSENYTINYAKGTLTVKPYGLIITWTDTELTYTGKEQKPTATISNPISGLDEPKITVSGSKTDAGEYYASARVDDSNYTIAEGGTTKFTIKGIKVNVANLIEKDYSADGITFSSSLLTGLFTTESGMVLSADEIANIFTINLNGAKAKNFSDDTATASETAGLFSYEPNEIIKAGSTYLISGIEITAKNKNYTISNSKPNIYLKYKTAKVGSTYYTIEDALNAGGDIVLESNSTKNNTYVITAFTSLNYYSTTRSFTTSRNIIVPHEAGKTASETETTTWSNENVGSVLIIPEGVSLTMNSSTLDILATVVHRGTQNVCSTGIHGVVMNQGTLTVSGVINSGNTPNIRAYGYLKGYGNVITENSATVEDLFHIYDFKGGANTYGIYDSTKNYLPINAYSIHDISCNIKVSAGCVYNAYYEITMGGEWFSGLIPIVGQSNAEFALFKLSSGYIEKNAIPAKSDKTSPNALNTITGSNQIKGQKEDVKIRGNAVDGAIKITVALIKAGITLAKINMTTSPTSPLPIPYMDIRVCTDGNLSLGSSSYKFMPGSSLIVDEGGTLSLSSGSNLVFYSIADCTNYEKPSEYKNKDGNIATYPYNYITSYCVDKITAYFEINSDKVSLNGGVSGRLTSNYNNTKLNLSVNSATIQVIDKMQAEAKSLLSYKYPDVSTRNVTMYATGDLITGLNDTHEESTLSAGTYYSREMSDGTFVWFKNTANITYNLNGGKYNSSSADVTEAPTLSANGYTLSISPSKDYYEFAGWFDSRVGGNQVTTIYSDCTVYAHWEAKEYTIKYVFPYEECGTLSDEKLYGDEVKALTNPANKEITKDGTNYSFTGWYLSSDYSGNAVSSVSAGKANASGIINVYANYISADSTYTVTFDVNPEGYSFNKDVLTPETQQAKKGMQTPVSGLFDLLSRYDYNSDTDFNYYFVGWYLSTDETKTPINALSSDISEDVTLCAKWVEKHVLTIEIESNDGKLNNNADFGDIIKYYKDETVDLESLYSEYDIAEQIDEDYAPHGSVKEYTRTEWKGTNSSTFIMSGDMTITAYHERCYYITVSSSDSHVTSGKGDFYVAPTEASYQLSVTCTTGTTERYTANYSATNASVDTSGKVTFTTDSQNDITVTVTTTHWFKVTNKYSKTGSSVTIEKVYGEYEKDGSNAWWYTTGSTIKITLKGVSGTKAKINSETLSVTGLSISASKQYTVNSAITITTA